MAFLGGLIGGLGGLLGGIGGLAGGFRSQPGTDWDVIRASQQFSERQLQEQMAFQREMAQNSISWRTQDAINSGISPLVALGAPTFSPSLQVGGADYSGGRPGSGGDIGGGLRAAGGALGDLAKFLRSSDVQDAQLELQRQQLERQNKLTDADIALKGAQAAYFAGKAAQPQAPSVISDTGGLAGQGNISGSVAGGGINKVPEIETHSPDAPGVGSGRARPSSDPYWTEGPNPRMYYQPAQGTPASQGDVFSSAEHWIRNRLMPNFSSNQENGTDPGIMNAIRQKYPDAVGYKHTGYGYYVPLFPRTDPYYRKFEYRD